ncbi:MAG: hypothetical protein HGA33_04410 [Candidatus Moranbacteria bacterium]|nr:hypothetical protein [Candidatus Moranbacteria bacterium]
MLQKEIGVNEPNVYSAGVGSFVFSIDLNSEKKIEDVILELSECLTKIPGVSSLAIKPAFDAPKKFYSGKTDLSFLNIYFDLNLSSDPDFSGNNNSLVFISKPFFDTTVAIVYSRGSDIDSSTYVYRVREYLKKYIRGSISISIIGPSPFHSDFIINIGQKNFELNINRLRGYDGITIFSTKTSVKEAIKEFFTEVGDEFNLFYLVEGIDAERIDSWGTIQESLEEIRLKTDATKFERLKRWFSIKHKITEIMQLVIDFESDYLDSTEMINSRYDDTYATDKRYVEPYVKQAIARMSTFPVSSVKQLLDFYISQREHSIQNLSTAASAILGGAIGAIITLFIK